MVPKGSKKCLSLIGGIKEFEIMVAEFVSAVSCSTLIVLVELMWLVVVHSLCWWNCCAKKIFAYSFEYNNNKSTFLSPYNALALKIDLSSTILDAYCYRWAFWNYFCDDQHDWKMSLVWCHFSLTCSGFKKYLNTTTVNFCKTNTLMVCINWLLCASVLLSSDRMDTQFAICTWKDLPIDFTRFCQYHRRAHVHKCQSPLPLPPVYAWERERERAN